MPIPDSSLVNERWRLRNCSIAAITQRGGPFAVGHIKGTDQIYCWRNGKTQSGLGYDLIEQIREGVYGD
jgi:hypothetical protein